MAKISGIDHVAVTVADMDASCNFYHDLFGTKTVAEYAPQGTVLVRQIALGGAVLSIINLVMGLT